MGRHRRDFQGERLTAKLHVQLTPSDRRQIDEAAASEGLGPTEFGRLLMLNGLRNYAIGGPARAAKREALLEAIERLRLTGIDLNKLTRQANEVQRLSRPRAVVIVAGRLVDIMGEVPARVPSRLPHNPALKKLLAEVAAIGNNVQQLRLLAAGRGTDEVKAALDQVDAQIAKTLDQVMPA